jgi:hypothetical protein
MKIQAWIRFDRYLSPFVHKPARRTVLISRLEKLVDGHTRSVAPLPAVNSIVQAAAVQQP